MKAFDSISHNSIWEALRSCKVDPWLRLLLEENLQRSEASVQTDEESEIFDIQKGSKQGDPMSSKHGVAVCIKKRIQRWQKKKGMVLERPRKKEWKFTRLPDELAIC